LVWIGDGVQDHAEDGDRFRVIEAHLAARKLERLEDVMTHPASGNDPCHLCAINHRHNNFLDFEARGAFVWAPALPDLLLSSASIVSTLLALLVDVQLL
jgi:hypothetical protein